MPYKTQRKKRNHNKTYYKMSTATASNDIQLISDFIESQQRKGKDYSYQTVKQHLYLTLQLDVKSTQKEVKPINQASEPPMFSKLSLEELRKFILDSEETIKELK